MGDRSGIQWTDATWNPVRGCSRVSAGCENCYAERQARRGDRPGGPYEGLTRSTSKGPVWSGKIRLVPEKLEDPLRWQKPRRIFVNSMSDLFHEDVPDEYIYGVLGVAALTPWHTYQILTKRPERMLEIMSAFRELEDVAVRSIVGAAMHQTGAYPVCQVDWDAWPLENVWLGVSIESQDHLDRWTALRDTPAAVRFISYEPALGPLDIFAHLHGPGGTCDREHHKLDWLIVGGESGPGARPCDVRWIRSIIKQCREAGVACFVKQLGPRPLIEQEDVFAPPHVEEHPPIEWRIGGKGDDPEIWPEDLRVREFPK